MDMALEKDEEEAEKEKHRIWMQYLSLIYSQKSEGKEPAKLSQARNEFVKSIQPTVKNEQNKVPAKVYHWDFKKLEQFKPS